MNEPAREIPQQEALALIPKTMATVYQILPLRLADEVLTIAIAKDNKAVKTDLQNLLGLRRVESVIWPADALREGIARHYTGRPEGTP